MRRAGFRAAGLLALCLLVPACGIGSGGGTLTPTTAPGIPADVTAIGGNGRVTLSWTSTGTPVTITVLRSQTSGGPYLPVSAPAQFQTPNSYVDLGLQNGTPYFYVLTATNPFGTSPSSAEVQGTPRFAVASVAPGSMANHTLALFEDGTVWGWGLNNSGEVGNGIQNYQDSPALVLGLPRVTALARGNEFSLALDASGAVWAWGDNTSVQLGLASGASLSLTPLKVPGLPTVTAISAGNGHALALASDGTVWAWGNNDFGQAGINSSGLPITRPLQVANLSGVIAISAGGIHSLALSHDGTVWAWGNNQVGSLGTGVNTGNVYVPVQVVNLNGVLEISAGAEHSLALRNDGTVWAWGSNLQGQLGCASSATSLATATQVSALISVVSIAAGSSHSLAAKANGTVWAWGSEYNSGTLGNGIQSGLSTVPVQVQNLTTAVAVSGGYFHAVAQEADGTLWLWGDNSTGQLGIGAGDQESTPVEVDNLTGATAVAGGSGNSMALRNDGTVWVWGGNQAGELGNGSTSGALTSLPTRVPGLASITAVAAGTAHFMANASDGSLWTWGANGTGQIGNGSTLASGGVSTPFHLVVPGATFTAVSAGGGFSLAVRNDATNAGTVWAWGDNTAGELGNGSSSATPVTSPSKVLNLTGITAVAAGNDHVLALKNDGTVWAWGLNSSGQVGNGAFSAIPVTTPVLVLSGIAAIAAGANHSLAVGTDGSVWAWGDNSYGEIGNGAAGGTVSSPTKIASFTGAITVSAGNYFSVAVRSDGTVWTWGINQDSELGDGTTVERMAPVPVTGLGGITAVSSGGTHTLALKNNGSVWAWGLNISDQLGTPFISSSAVPVVVPH